MKIFIGKRNSCNLNYQHFYIYGKLADKYEITNDVKDADIIVISETCVCTEFNLINTVYYISEILDMKKSSAKVFITGCIARKFIEDDFLLKIENWMKENVDYIIPQNEPNLLLKLISESEFVDLDLNEFGMVDRRFDNTASIFISNGCLNNCSFCKVNFQHYPLKSVIFDELKESLDYLDNEGIQKIWIKGTNICQYGLDNYHEYLLPEVIDYIESKNNIKEVSLVGFAFKDAIKGNFESVLRNSKKITNISGALESGSNRILELIRKGFTSEEIIEFITKINEVYKKDLLLNVIAGFPTETMDDVKKTLEVLKIINPSEVDICRYINSPFIDSNNFEQLPPEKIQDHARIYSRVLKQRGKKVRIQGLGYKYNK